MNQTIGNNIKQYRERLGLTQTVVAGYLDIPREMVSYYETGKRPISVQKLESLSDLFGVDLYDLLEEDARLQSADLYFAFRTGEMDPQSLQSIAQFRRIVKNYLKMQNLAQEEQDHGTDSEEMGE